MQGRGDAAEQTIADAIAVAEAGAFSVVMEMVPAELATQITGKLTIPTVGIGAGPTATPRCWCGRTWPVFTSGKTAQFVKRFGDVGANCTALQRSTRPTWRRGLPRRRAQFLSPG